MADTPSQRARELLAVEWGDHPQFAQIRERILDGSCHIHSDGMSLSSGIALRAIDTAYAQGRADERRAVAQIVDDVILGTISEAPSEVRPAIMPLLAGVSSRIGHAIAERDNHRGESDA